MLSGPALNLQSEVKCAREGQGVLKVTEGVVVAGLEPSPPGSQVTEICLVLVL